ncbi:MAG: four helix bundle protein [Opitutia bacterium]
MEARGLDQFKTWQKSVALAGDIIRFSQSSRLSRHPWFCDQIRRAALSVPSNIAEGYERRGEKDTPRFYLIAMGSCAEAKTQLRVAIHAQLVGEDEATPLCLACDEVLRLLSGVIRARRIASGN